MWQKFSNLLRIEILDIGFQVEVVHQIHSEEDTSHIASGQLTAGQLEQLEGRQENFALREAMNRYDIAAAQVAGAERLVQACPRLKQGWWWSIKNIGGAENIVERKGWTTSIGAYGEPGVKLSDGALWMKPSFVSGYR